ncbi:TetR/AcrR family transcriptional regulator [Rhizobium oryzicola]|uniref:TetR/AcrR family transcriptional regulator n=1 Tax=Rhizobium oryzicola TaxID=1232668 RepID=A0ABT8T0Y7_9HYPH|nr:TetR/AcrR family transcriptional regulator [Rhizobium oryzicola]MDO1584320.1 TetR/AcrR family transcriptional regulator [Rhizobium oryzicola]
MQVKSPVQCEGNSTSGRFAAGEDPAKREQILDGAKRVFMKLGFDAASMNDITREAGVSKGTIYVYFNGKDDLFSAIMERERQRLAHSMEDILAGREDVRDGLYRYGMGFIERITSESSISALRTMIAVVPRMPNLSRNFFQNDSFNVRTVLERFIERQVERGALSVADVTLAARQFIELSGGSFFKLRLFGDLADPPSQEEMHNSVTAAVHVFMCAYGANKKEGMPE